MPLLADYPFLDVMWTMLVFFCWIAWFSILFRVFADIFRRVTEVSDLREHALELSLITNRAGTNSRAITPPSFQAPNTPRGSDHSTRLQP